MAKSNQAQKAKVTTEKTINKPVFAPGKSLFERTELFLEKNQKKIFYVLLGISFFFSLLMFDVKVSTGGDDSSYIQRAYDFVQDMSKYPSYQGALYPLVLALPISVFGINLIFLKVMSVLFAMGHLLFMFLAFRRRIPWFILFTVLGYISVSKFINYYSSQTYNESFFLFIQALFLYVFFRFLDRIESGKTSLKESWKSYLLVAFCMLLVTITKNISIPIIAATGLFLLLRKAYRPMLILTAFFILLKLPYEMGTEAAFGRDDSQLKILMQKHPYDQSQGQEELSGFYKRLVNNFKIYLPKHTLRTLGLRSDKDTQWDTKANKFLGFLMLIFFVTAIMFALKRNRYVLFIMLYAGSVCTAMFILLQTFWDSDRLIIIFIPLILLVSLYCFYEMFRKSSFMKGVLVCFCALLILLNLFPAFAKISKNIPVIKKNIKGDIYYGYTPDWANYLEMSRWAADNLPEGSYVAVRKPSMSFIYGNGKTFYGVFSVTTTDPDSVLSNFKKSGVTHIMNASLRSDPNQIGRTINTIDRILQKVPAEKLVLVKQIGNTEPAWLYEIRY